MNDLISRQAALRSYQFEVCNKVKCYECKATDEDGTCKLERWIKKLPSAERHGQWKDIPFTARWICSNCDYISEFASFKYCPDCGARMDLEEDK